MSGGSLKYSRKDNEHGKRPPYSICPLPQASSTTFLDAVLMPTTPILAPIVPREVIERYVRCGWVSDPFLGRAFPRDHYGNAYIPLTWLKGAVKDLIAAGLASKEALDFAVVAEDRHGIVEVPYITIPDQPIAGTRSVRIRKGRRFTTIPEHYEFIDSTYSLRFTIASRHPRVVAYALKEAGKRFGIGGKRSQGYGRFRVIFTESLLEKENKERMKEADSETALSGNQCGSGASSEAHALTEAEQGEVVTA